jgi:hypothetical protein
MGAEILAVDPVSVGANWDAAGRLIPKAVVQGAQLLECELPSGFSLRTHEWNGSAVVLIGTVVTPPPVEVPAFVTKRQGRQMLLLAGRLDDVPVLLNAIEDETERRLALIYWEDSTEYERHHPLVEQIGTALGLDLDYMFIEGKKL